MTNLSKGKLYRAQKIKRTRGEKILYTIVFILFCILSLSYLAAIFWIFFSSLKESFEFAVGNIFDMPKVLQWSNYYKALTTLTVNGTGYLGMIWNTLWLTVGTTSLSLLSVVMCSYAYARYEFFGRRALYLISVIMMTLSLPSGAAASYKLYSEWGLKNSPLFLLGATNGLGTTFIMFAAFYRSISWEYAEAAFIDGCSDFTAWRKVMLPQAFPLIGTCFITSFVAGWQDYTTSMLYMTEYPTIAYGLYEYEATCIRGMNYPVYYAGLVLMIIPTMILFISLQGKIMQNMNIGGLKG